MTTYASRGIWSDSAAIVRALSGLAKLAVVIGLFATSMPTIFGGVFLLLVSYLLSFLQIPRAGSIEVGEGEVLIRRGRRTTRIRKKDVESAWIVTRVVEGMQLAAVEMRSNRGTTITAAVDDVEHARAVIEALGFGPRGRAVSVDLGRPVHRLLNPLLGLTAAVIGGTLAIVIKAVLAPDATSGLGSTALIAAAIAGLYAVLKRFTAPPIATVGQDGLRIRRYLRSVQVNRDDIRRVWIAETETSVFIERKSGRSEHVSTFLLDDARLRTFVELVDERLAPRAAPERAGAFERGGRDVATWRAEIRAALAPGYRSNGLTVEDAAEVLDSQHATVEQRLGAAIALRVAGEPSERIRVAAEGVVDPKVRIAFDAVADDVAHEELENALRRLNR